MDSLWSNLDLLDDVVTPKEILEEQGEFLRKATHDLVYGAVEEATIFDDAINDLVDEGNDFFFKFVLKSKFLERYSFTLFGLSHGIAIYPVKVQLDSQIAKELGVDITTWTCSSEKILLDTLRDVFNTKRTKSVISAIAKLAK